MNDEATGYYGCCGRSRARGHWEHCHRATGPDVLQTRQQMLEGYLREIRDRDSDRSGEASETRSGSTVGESAGPKDIAQTPSPSVSKEPPHDID